MRGKVATSSVRQYVHRAMLCYIAYGGNLARLQAAVEHDGYAAYMLKI